MAKAKFSFSPKDVNKALEKVMREEMLKEKKSHTDELIEDGKKGNYGDRCPHCSKLVSLSGKEGSWQNYNNELYLVEDCPECKNEIWCWLTIRRSSSSLMSSDILIGIFKKKEAVQRVVTKKEVVIENSIPIHKEDSPITISDTQVRIYDINEYRETMEEIGNT